MLFQLNIPNSYSKSNCKVNLFSPYSQCFLIFFEFRKKYYKTKICLSESILTPIGIVFSIYQIALSLTQWQAITYCKIKCLMFHVIFITPTLVFSTSCKWKMVCGIKTKVLVIVGETKWNG